MAKYIQRRHFCGLMTGSALAGFCPSCFAQALTPRQEKQLGTQEHPNIIQEFGGVYEDPKVGGYFALVASRLVRATGQVDIGFRFTLLNSPMVNAFALPGGFVYITRGLVAIAGDEAEIAGVIGHEIGHVVARHTSKRIEQAQRAEQNAALASILGAGTGRAEQQLARFSQNQEHEADVLGVRYMARAGYNPDGLSSFLRNLRAHSQLRAVLAGRPPNSVDEQDMMSSHPRTVDRVNHAVRLAKVARGGWQEKYRSTFLKNINGMVFGDDPEQGIVRGQTFSHGALRFAFNVPKGFHLENKPTEVVAAGPRGSGIMFDRASTPFQGSVQSYVADVWGRKAGLKDIQSIRINGMDAATGWIQAKTRNGVSTIRLVAIRYDRQNIYRFMFVAPSRLMSQLSYGFRQTTYSFHRISAAELGALRPLHIEVVKLPSSQTISSLAQRMAVSNHKEAWFRVLNDVDQLRTIPAGRRVKLVV